MYLSDLPGFVIASEKGHMSRVSGLQKHQQGENFQAVVPSVYEVPHEYVICLWDMASRFQQLQQVVKLAMYVPAHLKQECPTS